MAPAKAKKQVMSLGTFLTDENYGSWADEMEDMPLPSGPDSRSGYGGERRAFSSTTGFGGDRGDRFQERSGYPPREQLPLPDRPPFTAHLGNMSFDATSTDVSNFFTDCQVTNVRIVEDKLDHKPKGFGYVEFATLDGLKKALTYSGTQFQGRNIRISVAEPPKSAQDSTRDFSDWSRKGPLPELSSTQRRVSDRPSGYGGGGRSFDNMSDAGSDRASSRRGLDQQGDGKVRDFGNWERKGPLSPAASAAPTMRESGRQRSKDGDSYRRQSPAWGEGRSQDGSRPPRREYQDKPPIERAPMASELDNQWRTKMRPDAAPSKSPTPSRETSNPPSPAAPPAPTGRPKLNLQKRTVSEAVDPNQSVSATDSKASPFGAARPIDTFAREKEIEEKRELAIRQKKEAEDKAKAEKAEEKKLTKEREKEQAQAKAEKTDPTEQNEIKENGEEKSQPVKSFEILRRATGEENGMTADEEHEEGEEGEETSDPTLPVDDKAVKPKEVVRDIPPKANGAWRRGSEQAETPTETTANALEDEGWSTVSTKPRNNRRGNSQRQAIAS